MTTRIALVGDHDPGVTAHRAIPLALALASAELGAGVEAEWAATPELAHDPAGRLEGFGAVWCVPASPYASMGGALGAIRHARERGIPFLGTCGGFQHALVELARNVLGMAGADHAETGPAADHLVVAPLACSLVEETGTIRLAAGSRVRAAYGVPETVEGYHCRFGLNPAYRRAFESGGRVRFTGEDEAGEARAMELEGHPFFVATLFQPERAALRGVAPPLVRAFVRAALSASPGRPA
jgi:CTP synthase (UTP-ammonia lyase)